MVAAVAAREVAVDEVEVSSMNQLMNLMKHSTHHSSMKRAALKLSKERMSRMRAEAAACEDQVIRWLKEAMLRLKLLQ